MRKGIFKVIIFEVILFVLALTVNFYAVEKETQRQEERAIKEVSYIHNRGEEIRAKLADFIMVQRYRETWSENSEYEYNYYMYGDDTSKFIPYSIEELGEEEYEKIKKAVKIFSDEDIEKMEIYGYDVIERGGIIFSILGNSNKASFKMSYISFSLIVSTLTGITGTSCSSLRLSANFSVSG